MSELALRESVREALFDEVDRQTDGSWPISDDGVVGQVDAHLNFGELADAAIRAMREAIPREPTTAMLMAGRKQTFADMTGEHCGPNTENTWKAMYDAALTVQSTGEV